MRTFAIPFGKYAEIAQLVEHNLAKVRVASSSLVFRSKTGHLRMTLNFEKELRLKEYSPDGVQSYVSRPCAQGGFFIYIGVPVKHQKQHSLPEDPPHSVGPLPFREPMSSW